MAQRKSSDAPLGKDFFVPQSSNHRSSEYITVHAETAEAVLTCPANTCLAQKG